MPQPRSFDPSSPPPMAKRRCPVCGKPVFLVTIEPADDETGYERRTFECVSCPYEETITIKFG